MRHFNKILSVCGSMALGFLALTGCEGGEIYEVNAPDWVSEKVDSIANANKGTEEVLEGMEEDVYTIGNADFSSGWWAAFSKYYVVPDGEKWNGVFNLHINPSATNTYKNFALIICSDADRGAEDYKEYGAIRFDNQPSGNSEWGDYIDRSYVESTLTFETDTDAGVDKLGGKVTLTVDRTNAEAFTVTMTNGVVTKSYKQPYALENLNADPSNTNIRCFLVPEGSYIDFLQSNIEPIGGYTSAEDKEPVSMELQNVPARVNVGTTLEDAMADVTAIVSFEEGVTKTVTSADLSFSAIPDMDTPGEKILVAVYNKTFKGENCNQPVMANATFEVVEKIVSIEVTTQPTRNTYYVYTSAATEALTDRTLAFDPTGMVVTATYVNGTSKPVDNSILGFSTVPAIEGTQTVTITADEGVTATVDVKVAGSVVTSVSNSVSVVGAEDNSTAFWGAFSDEFNVPVGETKSISFTNYSSLAGNWNNFVVVLRGAALNEYGVVRADNYGWGNGYAACRAAGTQGDWATWLAGMNGAVVTVYVTNCGNGTADVQAIMQGTTGTTSTQYYLGINTVDPDDLNFALTVDGCHLVFDVD
ncbi:bacterial Ig-like domain-containing protein [Bacteroides caecigallinarum]|uniref:bacterial Ig-like domain-containing protein n=1 Tax=Bacteroides caecigallinarum TaxID=1411144 RepID=UPI00195AEBFC|nr:bacterial Ig-like domain-containing protein [Bacteroides caecigallinarum]MBM6890427.1 bacterial Ig-like domain-containing protein [Bacteroides caecigallinarum]